MQRKLEMNKQVRTAFIITKFDLHDYTYICTVLVLNVDAFFLPILREFFACGIFRMLLGIMINH